MEVLKDKTQTKTRPGINRPQEQARAAAGTSSEASARPLEKPRVCEFCGLEVDQRFRFRRFTCWFDRSGRFHYSPSLQNDSSLLCDIINCPEEIKPVRQMTSREKAGCQYYGAKYASLDAGASDNFVLLWSGKPLNLGGRFAERENARVLASAAQEFFPSVPPGECLAVEQGG